MVKLAPTTIQTLPNPVDGLRTKSKVSILERWQTIQTNLLHGKDDRSRRYKEELFGKSANYEYSDEYNALSVLRVNVDWVSADDYSRRVSIHTRAKLIAQTYLEGIIDTLQRHDDMMKKKLEAQINKTQGK